MSLRWDLTKVKHSNRVCFERVQKPSFEPGPEWEKGEDGSWTRLSPKTAALVWSTTQTGIPIVTSANIEEVLYRLDALFDAGVAFLFANTQEGLVPIRISRDDIVRHIGMETNANSWGPQDFDKHIRSLRTQRQLHGMLDPTTEL